MLGMIPFIIPAHQAQLERIDTLCALSELRIFDKRIKLVSEVVEYTAELESKRIDRA